MMKETLKKSSLKLIKNLALKTAIYEANTMCNFIYGQPKQPKKLQKLRKF